MAASNEWTVWHLTPNGWVRGSEKTDFDFEERPTPADCVLTARYKEFLSSSFSQLDTGSEIEWQHSEKALVDKLLAQFGEAPNHL